MKRAITIGAIVLGAVIALTTFSIATLPNKSDAPSAVGPAQAAQAALPILPFDIMLRDGRNLPAEDWRNAF